MISQFVDGDAIPQASSTRYRTAHPSFTFIYLFFTTLGVFFSFLPFQRENWLEGTFGNSGGISFGPMRTCVGQLCETFAWNDQSNPIFIGVAALSLSALILFALGLFFITFGILGFGAKQIMKGAPRIMTLGYFLQALAIMVFPLCTKFLGQDCTSGKGGGCQIPCLTGEWGWFSTCEPYVAGSFVILVCAGFFMLTIAQVFRPWVYSLPVG